MVDPSRFEYAQGQLHASDYQTQKQHQNMANTPKNTPAVKTSEIDSLRLQLTESDRIRRKLLAQCFSNYGGDVTPIIELLFAEASPETLARFEAMIKEGGAS